MKTVAVLSVGRSDYGIFQPVIRRMADSPSIRPVVIASGTHLSSAHGMTVSRIESDGFEIAARVDMLLSSDSPTAISKSMGVGMIGFAQAYNEIKPDLLMVLGDRFETMAGVLAALPLKIPVAHIHGGELTFGAIDDSMRHAITKLSHLHFVSTEVYGERVKQLGEEPWRVHVCGAPGLATQWFAPRMTSDEFALEFGARLPEGFLLVTYHPVTLVNRMSDTQEAVANLIKALEVVGLPVVFTAPNADSGGRLVQKLLTEAVDLHPDWLQFETLGTKGYAMAMRKAVAMVGNSSSGIIEAASFELPVVNIGSRQEGRVRGQNVIDCENIATEIVEAIRRATSSEFRQSLVGMKNPYGDGTAPSRIVEVLERTPFDDRLVHKRFTDTWVTP